MSNKPTPVSALLSKPSKSTPVSSGLDKQHDFDHEVIKPRVRRAGMEVFRISNLSNGHGVQYALIAGGMMRSF